MKTPFVIFDSVSVADTSCTSSLENTATLPDFGLFDARSLHLETLIVSFSLLIIDLGADQV
jgi:hypothetical protein